MVFGKWAFCIVPLPFSMPLTCGVHSSKHACISGSSPPPLLHLKQATFSAALEKPQQLTLQLKQNRQQPSFQISAFQKDMTCSFPIWLAASPCHAWLCLGRRRKELLPCVCRAQAVTGTDSEQADRQNRQNSNFLSVSPSFPSTSLREVEEEDGG